MRRALILVLATGCSKILGIGDVTRGDGGTSGGDVGIDAPANTVVGRSYTHCFTIDGGQVEVPIDLSQSVIQAMFVDPAQQTGFRSVNGTGKADGTFMISDVPDGMEYYLKINTVYYVTDQHVIDLHYDYPTRCTPAPAIATSASNLMLNITGMQPWKDNGFGTVDFLSVYSANLTYQGAASPQSVDDTAAVSTYNWLDGFSYITGSTAVPLPDAAAGDDIQIVHGRDQVLKVGTGREHTVETTIDYFQPTGVTLANAATVPVTGAFTPVSPTATVSFNFQRGAFDTGYEPNTKFSSAGAEIFAHPIMNDFGYMFQPALAYVDFNDWSRSPLLSETVTVNYGDPYPTSWKRFLEVDYQRTRFIRFPGTTSNTQVTVTNSRVQEYTGGNPTLTPMLQPPAKIKLAGTDGMMRDAALGGLVPFDGKKPVTVSWNPVANARVYVVSLRRVYANGTQTRSTSAGSVLTAASSAQLPAEMFTGGEFFMVSVTAERSASDYAAGHLTQNGLPTQFAGQPGAMFRFTATCGNGTVDTGESCDGSGETATCDVDCTPVACGDGLRNAAAGEACDTGGDTEACDSDCTLPVCGDGRRNATLEDCDDGNTTSDGNGCGTNCKYNNICGNGIVESLVETCDSGGVDTLNCDSDCSAPQCGDGHINTAAGEQCDNGINNGQGHCSAMCRNQ